MEEIRAQNDLWTNASEGEVAVTDAAFRRAQELVGRFARSAGVALFPTSDGGLRFQRRTRTALLALTVGATGEVAVRRTYTRSRPA